MSPRARARQPAAARAPELLLSLGVVLTVFALGGAAPWAVPAAALSGGLAVAAAALLAHSERAALPVPLVALPLLLLAAFSALQLVPLPVGLLGVPSPAAAELVRLHLQPLGLSPVRPVSLDPPATLTELSKALAYANLLISAAWVGRSRRACLRVAFVFAALGSLLALIALGHALLGERALFGGHAFSTSSPVVSPFGNPNHLAGYLILTAPLTLALAVAERSATRRLALGGSLLAQAGLAVASLSRAGVGLFAFAVVATFYLILRRRPDGGRAGRGRGVLGFAVALAIACAAVGYAGWDAVRAEFEAAATVEGVRATKVGMWPEFARAGHAYWRFGMGRGAFELGHVAHLDRPRPFSFTHAENAPLQLYAELGAVPAALVLLGALGAFISLLFRPTRTPVDTAALVAVGALGLHNLFDFSLELPAAAAAAAVLLGLASGARGGRALVELPRPTGVVAAGALASVAAWAIAPASYASAERALSRLLEGRPAPAALERAVLPLIDHHPASAVLYGAVGLVHASEPRGDARRALAWLNRALLLDPWNAQLHRAAARALLRLGRRSQGFGEYRLALRAAFAEREALVTEVLRAARTPDEVARAIPAEEQPVRDVALRLFHGGRPEDAARFVERSLAEVDEDDAVRGPMLALLSSLHRERRAFEPAERALAGAKAVAPEHPSVLLAEAELSLARGGPEALPRLQELVARHPSFLQGHFTLIRALLGARLHAKALAAIEGAKPFVADPRQRLELLTLELETYELQHRLGRAAELAETLVRLEPESPQRRYRLADLNARLGRYAEARRWLKEGAALDPERGAEEERRRLEQWRRDAHSESERLLQEPPPAR